MSAVIFTKSSIEAAGTPATGPFYYRPLTISPFRLMGFFYQSFFVAWALLPVIYCYRPLTTSSFCYMGSATGRSILPAPYQQPFFVS